MPTDKTKPLLPRIANAKHPITPRLAAQHLRVSPSPSLPSSTVSVRAEVAKPPSTRSPIPKDEGSTPLGAFLASNVTPRSSSRRTRIEANSQHSTPTSTPVQTPTQESAAASVRSPAGATTPIQSCHKRPKSVVLDKPGLGSPLVKSSSVASFSAARQASPVDGANPSFFHASDVKALDATPQPKKGPAFFYANGEKEPSNGFKLSRPASPTLSALSTKSHKSQFKRAKEGPNHDLLPSSPILSPSPDSASGNRPQFPIRPPSPLKTSLHLTYRKGASQVISPQHRPNPVPALPSLSSAQAPSSPTPAGPKLAAQLHGRADSLASLDSSPEARKTKPVALDVDVRANPYSKSEAPTSVPATHHDFAQAPTSNPNPAVDSRPATATSAQSPPASVSCSLPQSPTAQPNPQSTFAAAAANARRERKVLDLEISNSSLLAINRQLEREVRRQKTEIRRFRRLSRAGRLTSSGSIMTTATLDDEPPMLDPHGKLDNLLESSDDELSDSDADPDSSMSEESVTSSNFSASGLSFRENARLERDEKRLQLDLKRHRQLIVDSQKMNQALKRCMTWAEEMIAEGRRALEYKV
jgi:hypothetical protein